MTTARLKIIGTIVLLVLITALVIAVVTYGVWFLWGTINPRPTATPSPAPTRPTSTSTATQTATSTGTPTPTTTDTPSPTSTATPTRAATDTATPPPTDTPEPAPTDSPSPTSTDTPSPTALPERTATPIPSPTPIPTVTYPAPTLLEPAADLELSGIQRFVWQWNGPPLAETHAFDLRIWSETEEQTGQPRRGAVAPTQDTQADVDLQYVPAIQNYGSGNYYWSVVVVKLIPGGSTRVVGEWGEKRRFTYTGSGSPGGPGPTPKDTPVPPPKP